MAMRRIVLLFCFVLIMSVVHGKHLHPRSFMRLQENDGEGDNNSETVVEEIDGVPIDEISNMRPNRFVPINSVFFFKTYPPCDEGLERDLLGICREVWD